MKDTPGYLMISIVFIAPFLYVAFCGPKTLEVVKLNNFSAVKLKFQN